MGLGNGTETGNQPVTVWLRNSGAAVALGDIVVIGSSDNSFTTTNVPSTTSVLGVVYDANISGGSVGRIAISGVTLVRTDMAVTRGQHVITGSGTSGQAGSTATPPTGASIGVWLENGTAGGQTRLALLR